MDSGRNTIVILSGVGENESLDGLMDSLAALLREAGFIVEQFYLNRFDSIEKNRFFKLITSNNVKFGLTYLGIGQDLEVTDNNNINQNLWDVFNVPLLKIQGDSAAYFWARHQTTPKNSVNLYFSEEFLNFHRANWPLTQCLSAVCNPWIIDDIAESDINFLARAKGQLYFIKNGGNPEDVVNLWTSRLAPEVAAILIELSHELQHQVLSPGKLNLHQLVKAFLACRNIDIHENASLYCFFVAQLDDYFRRLKGTLVAQALLSCPVVIQGSRWEHLDTSRAVATLVPALDYTATGAIYQTQLGIINLAPNVDTSCHDRMLRAAGHHAFGLTNRSSWLEDLCPALSRTSFQFEPAHIREMVHTALEHPADCVELGREFGRRFRQAYPTGTFISQLCLLAELSRLQHAPDRPLLQPHIIW